MSRPTWTRKTYEMVAQALNAEYNACITLDGQAAVLNAAVALAQQFSSDNPSFDAARFYEAVQAR